MKKSLLAAGWQFIKVAASMFFAISFMRLATQFGATPLEAGFAVLVAAVLTGAYLICEAVSAFHPKIDEVVLVLGDIRRRDD